VQILRRLPNKDVQNQLRRLDTDRDDDFREICEQMGLKDRQLKCDRKLRRRDQCPSFVRLTRWRPWYLGTGLGYQGGPGQHAEAALRVGQGQARAATVPLGDPPLFAHPRRRRHPVCVRHRHGWLLGVKDLTELLIQALAHAARPAPRYHYWVLIERVVSQIILAGKGIDPAFDNTYKVSVKQLMSGLVETDKVWVSPNEHSGPCGELCSRYLPAWHDASVGHSTRRWRSRWRT